MSFHRGTLLLQRRIHFASYIGVVWHVIHGQSAELILVVAGLACFGTLLSELLRARALFNEVICIFEQKSLLLHVLLSGRVEVAWHVVLLAIV